MERFIICNRIRTPDGTILESTHRWDFQKYEDENGKTYIIDGGQDYLKRGGATDYEDLSIYSDHPHEIVRESVKVQINPWEYELLKDISLDYLEILSKSDIDQKYLPIYKKELEWRN